MDNSNILYYVNSGGKKYVAVDSNNFAVIVTEVAAESYSVNIDEEYLINPEEVPVVPYEEDLMVIGCDKTGPGQQTGQLICNISLASDSGDGDFNAEGLHITEDEITIISIDSFEPI